MDSGRQISLKGKRKGKVQAQRSSVRTVLPTATPTTTTPTTTGTPQPRALPTARVMPTWGEHSDVEMGSSDWENPSSPLHRTSFPSSDTDHDPFEEDVPSAMASEATVAARDGSQVTTVKAAKRFRVSFLLTPPVWAWGLTLVNQIDPFEQWKQHRMPSLQRLFVNEALGVGDGDGETLLCVGCSSDLLADPSSVPLRCRTCWLLPTFCKACLCTHHQRTPFHVVEVCHVIVFILLLANAHLRDGAELTGSRILSGNKV
jgi:hypothetical protein